MSIFRKPTQPRKYVSTSPSTNRIEISFNDHLLIVKIRGRTSLAYTRADIGESYWSEYILQLFQYTQQYLESGDEFYLNRIDSMVHETSGHCNLCHQTGSLSGGICGACRSENP